MSTSEPLRLFFALPCPAPVAHAVAAWRDRLQLPGKAVAAENLHLTLAVLGAQPRSRLDELKAIAAGIRGQAFELHLDRLGHWRAGLLHLLPSRPPEALLDLECSLRERLLQAGYELESRTFRPHLTLARHSSPPSGTVRPDFHWQAERFALYLSESDREGTRYRSLAHWPLCP